MPTTDTTDDLEMDLGWTLAVVSRAYRRAGAAAVAALPGGARGLHLLTAVSGEQPRTQQALSRLLGVDKSAMTYLLDELEAAKLVRRRPDPLDRRARQIVITARGAAKLAQMRGTLAVAEDELLAQLRPGEPEVLRELLRRVARITLTAEGTAPADC